MKSITVFCGSAPGNNPAYRMAAEGLGNLLARENIRLVYGGAQVGLMGAVADAVMDNGGEVIGVIPHFLGRKEIRHDGITELITVESMHERKTKMNELCDGVITLPGGFGTMEELFEMLTWSQLGLHQKPIGILNTVGYYDKLLELLKHMVDQGLLQPINYEMVLVDATPEGLLAKMRAYQAPELPRWLQANKDL